MRKIIKRFLCFVSNSFTLLGIVCCGVMLIAEFSWAYTTPQIAVGGNHSMVLKSNGTVWAWGLNDCGQLGDGELPTLEILRLK